MAAPSVSVVIPTRDGGPLLTAALESVLAQTFRDFEVLVCADGRSEDAAARAGAFGPTVRFLSIGHTGRPGAPRNRALAAARGELVAFLDDDDLWESGKLERQVTAMRRAPTLDATYTDRCVLHADGSRVPAAAPDPDARGSLLEEVLACSFPSVCTLVVRRAALTRAGGFDGTLATAEDFALWLKLARFARVARIPESFTVVRRRAGSLTDRSGPLAFTNGIAVLERELAAPGLDAGQRLLVRRTLARLEAGLAAVLAAGRDLPAARRAALRGLARFPASRNAWQALGQVWLGGRLGPSHRSV
jgi:hypothetical protein